MFILTIRSVLLFVVVVALASDASGATISTTTTCSVFEQPYPPAPGAPPPPPFQASVTDPNDCQLAGPNGRGVRTTASASGGLLGNEWRGETSLQSGFYSGPPDDWEPLQDWYSRGAATAEIALRASTVGPERMGVAEFFISVGGGGEYEPGLGTIDFGPLRLEMETAGLSVAFCSSPLGSSVGPFASCSGRLPFYLGRPFDVFVQGSAGSHFFPSSQGGLGALVSDFSFKLFEADGVTPVDLNEVPEPGTIILTLSALGLMAAARRRSRRP